VTENTVAALMREHYLAVRRKKRRKGTVRLGKGRWRAPDRVRRTSPPARSTASGTATAQRSAPVKGSSISRRCWIWRPAGSWGSRLASTTTRSWPMVRLLWR
jgi:hypothetical protein